MTMEKIDLNEPELGYTFSSCVVAGDFVFTSHQGGIVDDEGRMLGTIEEQTALTLRNVGAVLAAAGSSVEQVLKVTVYITDLALFPAMNQAYGEFFGTHRPARATAPVTALPKGLLVEIDAIAAVG